jgi:hypothetical protein
MDGTFKAVAMAERSCICDNIIEEGHLDNDWILVVNWIIISDTSSLKIKIEDNVQIHLRDNLSANRNEN